MSAPLPRLYARGPDGIAVDAQGYRCPGYPPIPNLRPGAAFQHGGHGGAAVPLRVHGWAWSTTFGRWSALVDFHDWHGYTYPVHGAEVSA